MPRMEDDPLLGHRVAPGSGGHDQWGFRNARVPESSSIVVVGDSMTYGIAATSRESWPMQLQASLGVDVYNMALGGYGPLHYIELVRNKATSLRPNLVIVSVYIGNDLMDAYNLAHSNDRWSEYRRVEHTEPFESALLIRSEGVDARFLGELRNYLASHVMLYRVLTQSAVFDSFRAKETKQRQDAVWSLVVDGQETLFFPEERLSLVDLADPMIAAGLDITLDAMRVLSSITSEAGLAVLVVIIPTKERVYFDALSSPNQGASQRDLALVGAIAEYEDRIRERITSQLESLGLPFIDVLPALSAAAEHSTIYPRTDDHPNGRGYGVIAMTVKDEACRIDRLRGLVGTLFDCGH